MPSASPGSPLDDPALEQYRPFLQYRTKAYTAEIERIRTLYGSLSVYAGQHLTLGVHRLTTPAGNIWRWREYMPNAESLWLTTDKLNFQRHAKYRF